MMERPRVAFFDLACCEGCQLQLANLGETLLDVLKLVDLVEFRELMSETWKGDYDIAFVEGSVVNEETAARLRQIRRRSKTLIAYGSCATIGGVNGMKNPRPLDETRAEVYGDRANWYPVEKTRALHQLVQVDYFIHGCPIYPGEFLRVFKAALAGLPYDVPDYSVCVECKFNENVCMYDRGVTCLGPVTRAGCNAWCINNGNVCYGCRGLVSNPNRAGSDEVLRAHGLDARDIVNKMMMYNAAMELADE
jgi:coenzyme F420-reducing hydrogenase gamma subunit